ncbi:NAD/NADP-dependent octopine/nopaline dehydrogenase family protein [Caldinitratiruptor microaerophilus]|uniref:Opine dehydrogenase n=1 Tax=Caldinitratiruptor microaerophilus TaxID=671077 RepID=A0AA35CJY0_9FIRM|nr:NAD/NADP-dependent octopine/nopaline dehydrogenase family protein [Caldinitratiruptor microaerophilus]BDG59859.1 hypothetical protein caldi_09490 [Caldinitratiruptor microaerophilus]
MFRTRPAAAGRRAGPRGSGRSLPPVAVLGAGHGGLPLAAYLALQGAPVRIWNRSPGPVAAVEVQGGIQLGLPDGTELLAEPERATCDIGAAVAGARVLLVALPATAHAGVASLLAPHLRPGQAVLLLPGRTGGALEFRRTLREHGAPPGVVVGEAQTFPFASRVVAPGVAAIHGIKREVPVAALPAGDTPLLLAAVSPLLSMVTAAPSVLHTSLENVGAMLHPVITLLNAGRIENDARGFEFYGDGVTPGVAAVLAAVDAERRAVAAAYGVQARALSEWIEAAYGHRAPDLHTAVARNPAYRGIRAPTVLSHRYLEEDVPTGLVPLAELGMAAEVPCPTMVALIRLASALHGVEYFRTGRTLERLGLGGLTPDGIRRFVLEGEVEACPA